jgi:RNA polymerase-binding transcription factor DksA
MKPNKALAKIPRRRKKPRAKSMRRRDDVAAAEARLDVGTFGLCEACGRPISLAQLRAVPTARRCARKASAMSARAGSLT